MASFMQAATRVGRRGPVRISVSVGVVYLGVLFLYRTLYSSPSKLKKTSSVILSPEYTVIPYLSQEEIAALPYPPDALPGPRDVDTPYGSIRVYEWGPENGKKIVMLHGISTPCISLAGLAHRLVEKGCRIMLFDLFGRGYSSSPSHIPHDSHLYTTQLFLVLASSHLSWSSFALLGYSLGGALAANFISNHPQLISHLILIAPGGLLRASHAGWSSRLLYAQPALLPAFLVEALVARRLWSGEEAQRSISEPAPALPPYPRSDNGRRGIASSSLYATSSTPLLPSRPGSTASRVVDWQIKNHAGFVKAFVSGMRYAPVHGQQEEWGRIGERLARQRREPGDEEAGRMGLEGGTVLLVLGARDEIVVAEEMGKDARACLGEEGVQVVIVDAGHEVPIERAAECAEVVGVYLGVGMEGGEGEGMMSDLLV